MHRHFGERSGEPLIWNVRGHRDGLRPPDARQRHGSRCVDGAACGEGLRDESSRHRRSGRTSRGLSVGKSLGPSGNPSG